MCRSALAKGWLVGVASMVATPLQPQEISSSCEVSPPPVPVVANASYDAGPFKRFLLGDGYRDLWVAEIEVPLLDLDRFAEGLELVERGGRKQTLVLRFIDRDGREYIFRSVDKDPFRARPPDLRGTFLGGLIRDQTSALFPAGALMVPPLLEAAGVIHVVPQLVLMPDDCRLGEHRAEFAGMLGTIEERPDEGEEERPRVGGSARIIGSDRFRERLLEGPEDLVDGRALLTARLMDAVLNDRDRHWDQWRWGEFPDGETRYWRPIPEDRDYAFVDFDGVILSLARRAFPQILAFSDRFPTAGAFSHNTYEMDRRLLAELPVEVWDSIALALQQRISDEAIAEAIGRLPVPYQDLAGERLEEVLRARRDGLPDFARDWYDWLSTAVDVHGTDLPELARIDYDADGSVVLKLYELDEDDPKKKPFFERRLLPDDTGEVRVYLHGGDDRAVVRSGEAKSSILVRVIGGDGDDMMVDSSQVTGAGRVFLYDQPGEENSFELARATRLDTVPFTAPVDEDPITGARYRDFGSEVGTMPILGYGSTLGLVVGAGRTWTRYGFRQVPYAQRATVQGSVSFRLKAGALEFHVDRRRPNTIRGASLALAATQLEPFHFFGLGNDTRQTAETEAYLVEQDVLLLQPTLDFYFAPRSHLEFGPVVRYSNRRPRDESRDVGGEALEGGFGQIGARALASLDLRDEPAMPRTGVRASFAGSTYGGLWSAAAPFGDLRAEIATYLTPSALDRATLAVRGGAHQVWGDYPLHQAAFLGGWDTLRGYDDERFAGDSAIWGVLETRLFLTRANLLVRGDLGALLFADAGRVYLDGESPGGWHTSAGGGLYFLFRFQQMPIVSTLLYARGEIDRFRVQLGVPF